MLHKQKDTSTVCTVVNCQSINIVLEVPPNNQNSCSHPISPKTTGHTQSAKPTNAFKPRLPSAQIQRASPQNWTQADCKVNDCLLIHNHDDESTSNLITTTTAGGRRQHWTMARAGMYPDHLELISQSQSSIDVKD